MITNNKLFACNKLQVLTLLLIGLVSIQSCSDDADPSADDSNYMSVSFDGSTWEATVVVGGFDNELLVVTGERTDGDISEQFLIGIENPSEDTYTLGLEASASVVYMINNSITALSSFGSIDGQITIESLSDQSVSGTFSFTGLDVLDFGNVTTKSFTNGRFKTSSLTNQFQ